MPAPMDFGLMLDFVLLGIFPYVATLTLGVGSVLRFVLAPYSWKSASSELWGRRELMLGSYLFHAGVLMLFAGHIAGLFTPLWVFDALGVTPRLHQVLEEVMGSASMLLAIAGVLILLHRRLTDPRVRATTRGSDFFVLGWLLLTLLLGAGCVTHSMLYDANGVALVVFGRWARGVATFDPRAWTLMVGAPLVYKAHIFCGLTLFAVLPFTRLVHIWSGAATLGYLPRAHQLMRMRARSA